MDRGMDRNAIIFRNFLEPRDLQCSSMSLGKTTNLSETNPSLSAGSPVLSHAN